MVQVSQMILYKFHTVGVRRHGVLTDDMVEVSHIIWYKPHR